MGDRTTVEISIRKIDYNNLIKNRKEDFAAKHGIDEINSDIRPELVTFLGYEINYGEWDSLEGFLKDNNIEYDKSWGAGCEYQAGQSWYRIIDGGGSEFELYEGQEIIRDFTEKLKESLDDPDNLKKLILEKYEAYHPFKIRPLDEPNSVNFMKKDK